jgi:hypothetical protein
VQHQSLAWGKLHGQPAKRSPRRANRSWTLKVRVHAEHSNVFANFIAFSPADCEGLLALGDGDAVALAGSLTAKGWTDLECTGRRPHNGRCLCVSSRPIPR